MPGSSQRQTRDADTPDNASGASSPASTPNSANQQDAISLQTKLLVRLALSTEFARGTLRRPDINARCGTTAATFRAVFENAQLALRDTFGMELVELPSREKVTHRERLAATQKSQSAGGAAVAQKTWILTSVLPPELRQALAEHDVGVGGVGAARSAAGPVEASYVALYTFVVSLIMLSGGSLAESKLERHLKAVNAETSTPVDTTQKLLERMRREGYVERKVENMNGDEMVEYFVGPRGKVEVGEKGVGGLVRNVYGDMTEDDSHELEEKIERSLRIAGGRAHPAAGGETDGLEEAETALSNGARGKGKRPRTIRDDDDDDD